MMSTPSVARVAFAWLATLLAGSARCASPYDVESLPLSIHANALTPYVVADPVRDRFLLSWQERLPDGCARLQVATLSRSRQLGEPQTVAQGCNWFVNWADHPKIAIADNGDWWAFWLQMEGEGTYHYGIRVSHSQDEGAHWSAPITPHTDGVLSEHGFVSMAADGADRMRLIWLDGRVSASGSHAETAAPADSHASHAASMSLRGSVMDRSGTLSEDVELDGNTCSCCWTALLRQPDGRHLAAWRDRSDQEIRDIAYAEHEADGWQVRGLVNADNWKISACPVNGPGLAQQGSKVIVAWSTMHSDTDLAVKLKQLGTEQAPIRIEQGTKVLGRVSTAAFDDGFLLSWLGADDSNDSVLRLAKLDHDLHEQFRVDIAHLPAGRGIGVPHLAALSDVAVLVWTEPRPPLSTHAAAETRIAARLIRRPTSGD